MNDYTKTAWPSLSQLYAGDFRAQKTATVKTGEGELDRGTVLAVDQATDKYVALVKETAVDDEVIGVGAEGLTSVTAEALVTDAGGTLTEFHVKTAQQGIVPGTVDGDATVGAAAKTFTDDGNGLITGDSGNIIGTVDYTAGFIFLKFATAPDDDTNITADYDYGVDVATVTDTLENVPVIPRTVTVVATVGAAAKTGTDDGYGNISGTGISGTVNYESGAITITTTAAIDDGEDVVCDYSYGSTLDKHIPAAILVNDVDATSADVSAEIALVGEYRDADLTWPASITAANKARAKEHLQAQGLVVK